MGGCHCLDRAPRLAPQVLLVLVLLVSHTAAQWETQEGSPQLVKVADSHDEAVLMTLRAVSDQLEKFSTLYVGKLESRALTTATLLANIDSNIKNLQERAHVWDTFQLHVAAWNEQIKALDRKMDLLSRGQEQLPILDGKVGQLLATEESLARLATRMDEVDARLAGMARSLEEAANAESSSTVPLLGEFATRGALTALKGIERKVDRLSSQLRSEERSHHGEPVSSPGGGRLVVRCQTPPALEATLHDVAAKVDVLFDRLPEEGEGELRSGESALLSRVFRRLASPLRRTWKALEGVERAVRSSEELSSALRDGQREIMTVANRTFAHALHGSECCLSRREADRGWRAETKGVLREFRSSLLNASREREQLALHLDEISIEHNASACQAALAGREDEESVESRSSDEEEGEEDSDSSLEEEEEETSALWLCHELPAGAPSGVTDPLGVRVTEQSPALAGEELLLCDQHTAGGGWTVVHQRGDFGLPRLNFTRSWSEYRGGFGDLRREFWAGLEFLHRASHSARPLRLRVELQDFEGNSTYAEYSVFRVAAEEAQYRLRVASYSGNASDSLGAHDGVPFSTVDRDNDEAPECCACAPAYGGGWWFYSCFEANLNGEFYLPAEDNSYFKGIIWEHWRGDYSLAAARMMVRPADYTPPQRQLGT